MTVKCLILGGEGQLGRELRESVPADIDTVSGGREWVDLRSPSNVKEIVEAEGPDVIVNAAAYTSVDGAEADPNAAFAVNATGTSVLARSAKKLGCSIIHISTDFVFDGNHSSPYSRGDPVCPINSYGKSKARGEELLREIYAEGAIIVRTSWLYSIFGDNFVKTMLGLMRNGGEVRVVADRIGSPTWARNLTSVIWSFVMRRPPVGIYHWSDEGSVSWYEFACAINEDAAGMGLIAGNAKVVPVTTEQHATRAPRPRYSVLDKTDTVKVVGRKPDHWRVALRRMLAQLGDERKRGIVDTTTAE